MNAWRAFLVLALALPAALIAVCVLLVRWQLDTAADRPGDPVRLDVLLGTTAALGIVTGWSMMLVVGLLWRERRQRQALDDEHAFLHMSLQRRVREMRHLKGEYDLLAAMREIARLVNRKVRFQDLIGEVLDRVGALIEAEQVTLFLGEMTDEFQTLAPRASWQGGVTAFGADIDHAGVGADIAAQAAQERHMTRRLDGPRYEVAVPLHADREVVGVIVVRKNLESAVSDDAARLRDFERSLRALLTHVGLAVKKPALHDRANTDPLTALGTRRAFDEELARAFAAARRLERPLSLLVLDADHFKAVNDTHGHLVGDHVLATLGRGILEELGETAPAFRYGGEELALVLPASASSAPDADLCLAESLRTRIEAQAVPLPGQGALSVTVSIGVARLDDRMATPADLVAAADAALYRAKREGRNRVVCYHPGDRFAPEDVVSDPIPSGRASPEPS